MPTAAGRLRTLGVTVQGRPFVGIRYVGLDREVAATFRHGPGLGVRRTTLHAALAAAADRAGVCRVEGRVRDVADDGATVAAAGMRARWLVAADGLHSTVRREAGLDVPAAGRSPVLRQGANWRRCGRRLRAATEWLPGMLLPCNGTPGQRRTGAGTPSGPRRS